MPFKHDDKFEQKTPPPEICFCLHRWTNLFIYYFFQKYGFAIHNQYIFSRIKYIMAMLALNKYFNFIESKTVTGLDGSLTLQLKKKKILVLSGVIRMVTRAK